MNELALFAGAGGGILGTHILGFTTVAAVEIDPYCISVLLQRQNDGILPPFPIWDDIRTFDGKPWKGIVDVVSGGFPCQDISAAGKGKGINGERSGLWREMARVINEVRPRYIIVENSPLLVGRGLDTVLADLAKMGYDAQWGIIGASDVGAPHKRDRIWIVGVSMRGGCDRDYWRSTETQPENGCKQLEEKIDSYSNSKCCKKQWIKKSDESKFHITGCVCQNLADSTCYGRNQKRGGKPKGWKMRSTTVKRGCAMANTKNKRYVRRNWTLESIETENNDRRSKEYGGWKWWSFEPDVGRVANGVAFRVDRIKALGNGQVPAVVARAWKAMI